VFGRTVNPFNRNLTPGGSSGGESALIAARGSVIGVGTDIGGSIRVPAGYMGLYGLKASVARIPHAGLNGSHDGMDAIVGVMGPIARSARDLSLFCRVMLLYEPWNLEPAIIEIPWKQDLAEGVGIPSKLSFAIMWDDGVVAPHEPISNALKRTKDALIAAGHDVIVWEPLDHQGAWDLIVRNPIRVMLVNSPSSCTTLTPRPRSTSLTAGKSTVGCWSMNQRFPKPIGFCLAFPTAASRSRLPSSSRSRAREKTSVQR
jgi:amidase